MTGFLGMVRCGKCNYNDQTQSVDALWLNVGSVPFSMGKSFFLRAASTFMSATTLLAKLITKSIWGELDGHGGTQPCIQAKSTRHPRGCVGRSPTIFFIFIFFPVKIT